MSSTCYKHRFITQKVCQGDVSLIVTKPTLVDQKCRFTKQREEVVSTLIT